jgi:hypothetical protein
MMDYNVVVKEAHKQGLNNNQIAARYFITAIQVSEILAGNTPIKAAGKKKEAAAVEINK